MDSAPFFDLGEWTTFTTFVFSPTPAGTQGIELTADASDEGGASINMNGDFGSGQDSTFDFSAVGVVQIAGAPIDLDGAIASNVDGTVDYAINGELAEPVTLTEDVTLLALDVQHSPEETIGTGTVSIGGNAFTVDLDYTSDIDWELDVTNETGWELAAGLEIAPGGVAGSILSLIHISEPTRPY